MRSGEVLVPPLSQLEALRGVEEIQQILQAIHLRESQLEDELEQLISQSLGIEQHLDTLDTLPYSIRSLPTLLH